MEQGSGIQFVLDALSQGLQGVHTGNLESCSTLGSEVAWQKLCAPKHPGAKNCVVQIHKRSQRCYDGAQFLKLPPTRESMAVMLFISSP
jgi:hypothetical protein